MDIGHAGSEMHGTPEGGTTAVMEPFVYEPGRTIYMMPFTDAEEEAAWDLAAEAMRK